jgi:hypothetical protein
VPVPLFNYEVESRCAFVRARMRGCVQICVCVLVGAFGVLTSSSAVQFDVGYELEWSWHALMGNPWLNPEPIPERMCPGKPKACQHH